MEKLRARDLESPQEVGELRFMVYSFDVKTGKVRWEQEAHKGLPIGGRHRKNTYASETPATDGERIYALFGNIGLFCLRDGRQAAVDATRSIRSRATSTSAPRRRRSCTTAASTSRTTTRRARTSPRSTRRPAR